MASLDQAHMQHKMLKKLSAVELFNHHHVSNLPFPFRHRLSYPSLHTISGTGDAKMRGDLLDVIQENNFMGAKEATFSTSAYYLGSM